MDVVKLSLVIDRDSTGSLKAGHEVAYLYPGKMGKEGSEWADPFGGVFLDEEQAMLQRIACGTSRSVVLGAGTKFEKTLHLRLIATFI